MATAYYMGAEKMQQVKQINYTRNYVPNIYIGLIAFICMDFKYYDS